MSGAAFRVMFISTNAAVFPTFACLGSVSVTLASEALGQGLVLSEEVSL